LKATAVSPNQSTPIYGFATRNPKEPDFHIPSFWIANWISKHLQKHGLEQGSTEIITHPAQAAQPVGACEQVGDAALFGQGREGNAKTFKDFFIYFGKCCAPSKCFDLWCEILESKEAVNCIKPLVRNNAFESLVSAKRK